MGNNINLPKYGEPTEREQLTFQVLLGLERAYEKAKHLKKFNLRIRSIIQAELPEFTISCETPGTYDNLAGVKVWGNGLKYDNMVYLLWSGVRYPNWQEGFIAQLETQNPSDRIERRAQEKNLDEQHFNFAELENRIKEIQERAKDAVRFLPVPPSATVRKNKNHWSSPSRELKAKYPLLFG